MNVFNLGINLAIEELNINDYIVLTLIKVFEPNLYEYIKNNKDYFSGTKFNEFLNKDKKEILGELEEIYKKLKKLEKRKVKRLMEAIFPKLKETNYDESFIDIWDKARRIATPVYFESYFRLDFPEDEIKKSEIEKFKKFSTEEDLIEIFNMDNKKRIRFLELITGEIEENQLNNLKDIAITKILKESEKSEKIESDLLNILYTMKRLGKEEEAKKVFKNYLKNKNLLIDFIKEFIITRTTEINYSIRESTYLVKDSIEDFYDYEEFVKIVDENFTNPNEEECKVINQLKNAITREELEKD